MSAATPCSSSNRILSPGGHLMRGVARTGLLLGGLLLAGAVQAADWEPVTAELLKKEKTGFGGLCGVVVDRKTGALVVDLSDRGLFRSADGGKTWEPLG